MTSLWKRVEAERPPIGSKVLFLTDGGELGIGIWRENTKWKFWAELPELNEKDKDWTRSSATGRFVDGKSYEGV